MPAILQCPQQCFAGDPAEKLILKSDCNHGGRKERLLDRKTRVRLKLPPDSTVIDGNLDYPIRTRGQLTDEWEDSGLAIERLIENSRGIYYRVYVMCGRLVISRFNQTESANPIQRIKGARARDNFLYADCGQLLKSPERGDELSPRLKSVVATFVDGVQLDFGALDVVEDNEDNFYVIDLNITPYWGTPGQPEMTAFLRRE